MRKQPYEVYGYQREWPSKQFTIRFLYGVLIVLLLFGLEAMWSLYFK